MIDDKTKQRWREQILEEYPSLHPDMVDSLLHVYSEDPDWIQEKTKHLKKETRGKLEPKRQLTIDELERLTAKGQAEVERIHAWYAEAYEKYDHTLEDVTPLTQQAIDDGESACGSQAGSPENHPESV